MVAPALLFGGALAMLDQGLGLILGVGITCLGLELTQARPERDEA